MKLEPVAWLVSEDGRKWPTNSEAELMAFAAIPGTEITPLYAIPTRYALVPVEPTAAMNFAAYDECQRVSTVQVGLSTIAALYKAMIASAAKGE